MTTTDMSIMIVYSVGPKTQANAFFSRFMHQGTRLGAPGASINLQQITVSLAVYSKGKLDAVH